MSTKVKGDKIKEGSIPLSALSEEIKNKIEGAGGSNTTPDWNAQQGEAGYIENKPCAHARIFKFNAEYDYKDDSNFYVNIEYLGELWIDGDEFGAIRINDYTDTYRYTFYKDFNTSAIRDYFDMEYGIDVKMDYQDIGLGWDTHCLIVNTTDEERFKEIINLMEFNAEYNYERNYSDPKDLFFIPLDDSFIPDTVIKTTPQSLSTNAKNQVKENLGITDAVTPDWNAQEGEAGYIENKPFEFIDKHENAFYYDTDVNPNYIIWDSPSAYDSPVIQILDYDGYPQYIFLDDKTDGSLYNMDNIFGPSLNYKWLTDINELGIEIPSYILNEGEDVTTYLNELIKCSTGGIVRKIPDVYLPNTVIKTTPQTLSDTDKKQALTNLGIADLLEALKPVRLSDFPPVGNVTQEQLDEIGLTEKVINNILNGYTNKICLHSNTYCVIRISKTDAASEFVFADFYFNSVNIDTITQYRYHKYLDEITIEFEEV